MNITQERIDDLNALLKVQISAADYQDKVEAVIKNYRKTANIPGFRKGKVPVGQIKKMYGKAILVEEVNKLIQEAIYNYITENKIEVLGNPLPTTTDLDWDNTTEFNFEFEMGLSPAFEVNMDKKSKFDYYKIEADKKMVDHYTSDMAKRYGSMINPEKSEKEDLIMGEFTQLDSEGNVLEDGINHSASVALDIVSDKKAQKVLTGVTKDDEVVVKITNKFSSDVAHMLNISKEDAKILNSNFRFKIKNISRMTPAEMNQDLFDKVFGKDEVKNEKEFKAKIKEEVEKSFVGESDNKLKNDVILHLIDKVNLELPDTFLKKWLVQTNENGLTAEQVEAEYEQYSKSLKWQLIENKIIKDNDLEVKNEDVVAHTRELIVQNFAQYGQPAPEDKKLDEIAAQVLTNEEERKKVYNQLYDAKTLMLYKEKFKLTEKTVTYDEFVKLASEQ
ncbi:MAG: trigger factor [Flavobacteriales bacterium]|nr:trigger factor [Flavobacteriales bacterium]|tara:strand:- start:39761 stop:41101 length:1341 start_codon:yes stop_codon:yes gene_type:complete